MTIQNNKLFRIIDKAFTILTCAILGLVILLIPIDTYEFLRQPKDYITTHHLDPSKDYWQFEYLKGSMLIFFGALCLGILILVFYNNEENKRLRAIRQILVFGLVVIIISGYYKWSLTGFDH